MLKNFILHALTSSRFLACDLPYKAVLLGSILFVIPLTDLPHTFLCSKFELFVPFGCLEIVLNIKVNIFSVLNDP